MNLSMSWKFDKSTQDSYSYNDNYYDVKIARKVAKDFGLKHHTLSFSTELPSFETLHRFLADSRYPFFKYSAVFDYMVHESLQKLYDRDHQDRKSTRLNSSHVAISYAVFFLKKKTY